MSIVWGEWQYSRRPDVGDYIQLRVESEITAERRTVEGFVTRTTEEGMVSLYSPENWDDFWIWLRWRRGALPEYQGEKRMQESDA